MTPFSIREQDADEVVTLIERFITRGQRRKTAAGESVAAASTEKIKRVRVDENTATDGWY